MPDDVLGSLRINVSADLADLQSELNKIPSLVSDAISSIPAAGGGLGAETFEDFSERMRAAGAEASKDLEEIAAAEKKAGDAARDAGDGMGEFGNALGEASRGLVELLEKLGLALGAYELIKESLGAFSEAQDIQTSFKLLSGNADTAADAMEHLKKMADDLAVSEEDMLATAQRLAPQLGVGTKAMDDALRASADVAAATGRSFDSVAASILRIEESGQVGKRQLDQLGISIGDVADTMGKTVSEATALLKSGAMDASTDVQVIIDTIERRYAGAAEAISTNLSGSFTQLKNELHQLAEDMGTALAPVAQDLINITKTEILPFISDLVKAFGSLPEPVRNAGIEVAALSAAMKTLGASTPLALVVSLSIVGYSGSSFQAENSLIGATIKTLAENLLGLKPAADTGGKAIDDLMGKTSAAGDIFKLFGITEKETGDTTDDYSNKLLAAAAAKKVVELAAADLKKADSDYAEFIKATYIPAILSVEDAEKNVADARAVYESVAKAESATRAQIAATDQSDIATLTDLESTFADQAEASKVAHEHYTQALKDQTLSKSTLATVTKDLASADAAIASATKSTYIPALLDHETALQNVADAEAAQQVAIENVRKAKADESAAYAAATKDVNGNIVVTNDLKAAQDALAKAKVDLTNATTKVTQANKDENDSAKLLLGSEKLIEATEVQQIATRGKLYPATTSIAKATADYTQALKDTKAASAAVDDAELDLSIARGNAIAGLGGSGGGLIDAEDRLKTAREVLTTSTKTLDDTQRKLVDGFHLSRDAVDEITRHTDDYTAAQIRSVAETSELGIPSLEGLQRAAAQAQAAYDDLANKGFPNYTVALEASVTQQQTAIDAAVQMGEDTTNMRIDLDATTEALKRQTQGMYDLAVSLKGDELSGLQSASHDLIFNIDGVGDAFKKMGESMVDTVVNRILKDAMSPLLDSLDKVIAKAVTALEKVTGIGVNSIPTPGVGGIPGVYHPTISDIPGIPGTGGGGGVFDEKMHPDDGTTGTPGIPGSPTGLLGKLNLLASGISAATGIVSIFQNMHQETSLNAIESNTRVGALYTLAILDEAQGARQWNWDHLFPNINGLMDTLSAMRGVLNDVRATLNNIFIDIADIDTNVQRLPQALQGVFQSVTGHVYLDGRELSASFVEFLTQSGIKMPQS